VEIIDALSVHPQLETLALEWMNIGRNECAALANVLNSTMAALQELSLFNNAIDDEGVDILAGALTNSRLRVLNLHNNVSITAGGCQSLAVLLEHPNSDLEKLHLVNNNIGNEGAQIFANALANNRKLKLLYLSSNGITAEGWSSFLKLLCDTSSINNTFLSNHTLCSFGVVANPPADLISFLDLNHSSENKRQVAIKKILKCHHHFDMQPFLEWDLKLLPIAINWFERARSVGSNDATGITKHKLGAIYQFIRAMPEVFEPAPAAVGQMGE
jgi:Ran GTPase-activating protein (RanGAP) involved in mRNA processing and transport